MKKPRESELFLAQKREAERLARIRTSRRPSLYDHLRKAFFYQNGRVLHSLVSRRNPYAGYTYRPLERLTVPSIFCFQDNAHATAEFLLKFAAIAYSRTTHRIDLSHQECTRVGLGAEGILGLIAKAAVERGKRIHGRVPRDEDMKRLVWAIGTPRILGVAKYGDREIRDGHLRVLTHRSTLFEDELADVRSADPKGKAIAKIIGHLNDCLVNHGARLTSENIDHLVRYLGEIIGNAEEHAGITDWTVMGYLDNMRTGLHECELVLFNFGRSIAESFQELPEDDPMLLEVLAYVRHHTQSGWFSRTWRPDDLLTLVAMQGHVSCKRTQDPTRGNGTIEAISVFQELSNASCGNSGTEVAMSLVSGSTQIVFTQKYPMRKVGSGRIVIAFNEENDLNSPPDPMYIKHLDGLFLPATVITIRFPLLQESVAGCDDG